MSHFEWMVSFKFVNIIEKEMFNYYSFVNNFESNNFSPQTIVSNFKFLT